MEYAVRNAMKKDVAMVYKFICLLEENIFDYAGFDQIFTTNLGDADCHYLVAQDGQENVIGFISCHVQNLLHHGGRVAEIQELFVMEKHRGNGIGETLLAALQQKLVKAAVLSLEVTAQNKRLQTHAFYQDKGFLHTHLKFTMVLG